MKTLFYLFTILLLSLLLACSEEPPTNVDSELLSKKPIPPPPPDPLPALYQGTTYIAGDIAAGRRTDPKVFIWDASSLSNIWSTSIEAFTINGLGIGNFMDDNDKELLLQRRIETGKGHNKTEKQELLIFKEGDSEPSNIIELREFNGYADAVWDMKVGNVDGDSNLEIIMVFRDQLEVWECDGSDFYLADSWYYFSSSESPWRATIDDIDGDFVNEILVAFTGNKWRVYKYDGSSISQLPETAAYNDIGSLNSVKVADVDNDSDLEVIGGSSSNKVLLWEYPFTNQSDIVASQEFQYSPWAIGINGQEILAGLSMGGLHLLSYNGNSFNYEFEIDQEMEVALDGIVVTDINNNSNLEIVIATRSGLQIFDNSYSNIFNDNVGELQRVICQ
jgi:hypothetical protein